MKRHRNIYLTGFMASGKTIVGRALARRLRRRFVDTDAEIVRLAGKSIDALFRRHGEAHFRKLESQVIASLARQTNLVVSLGGGAVLSPANRQVFRQGYWCFLDTPLTLILQRLKNPRGRPLARKGQEELITLHRRRWPIYGEANFIIRCGTDAPDRVCQKLVQALKTFC